MLNNIYILSIFTLLLGGGLNLFLHIGLASASIVGIVAGYIYSAQHKIQIPFKKALVIASIYAVFSMLSTLFFGEAAKTLSLEMNLSIAVLFILLYVVIILVSMAIGSLFYMRIVGRKNKVK